MGKRKGVPVSVIKESLGHSSESVTQVYLDSFENEVIDSYDEVILKELSRYKSVYQLLKRISP